MLRVFSCLTFHEGGRNHIETRPLICGANQWTGFYMITASVMKELNLTPFGQTFPNGNRNGNGNLL